MIALFLVGPPAAGKTSISRELIGPDTTLVEKPKWTLGSDICAAGHYTGQVFDGADTVPYNGANDCLNYWYTYLFPLQQYQTILLDGDRFSQQGTVDYFSSHNIKSVGVYITTSDEKLDQRRQDRGSDQNPSWLKGRATKARRFSQTISHIDLFDPTVEEAVQKIRGFIELSKLT